eukprot:m.29639 g.29639  ORF g.29639 m.29639 type:complete len:229 (+) comp11960_c0_seq1:147-833(+)
MRCLLAFAAVLVLAKANILLFFYNNDNCNGDPGQFVAMNNPPCRQTSEGSERFACEDGRFYQTSYTSSDCSGTGIVQPENGKASPLDCDEGSRSYCTPASGDVISKKVFSAILTTYTGNSCDEDSIETMVGLALGFCDADEDDGTSEKLVSENGEFVQYEYSNADCSGASADNSTFSSQECVSYNGGKISIAVFDKPVSFNSVAGAATATVVSATTSLMVMLVLVMLS